METSFEVYVRKKGETRWVLESRYGANEKDGAINDAKAIERQTTVEAVRVVRENHYPETNVTRETVVYTTIGLAKKKAPSSAAPSPAAASFDQDEDRDEDEESGPPAGGRVRSMFRRAKKKGELYT